MDINIIVFMLTLIAMIMASVFCMYSKFNIYVKSFSIVYLICTTVLVMMLVKSQLGFAVYWKTLPDDLIVHGGKGKTNMDAGWIEIQCNLPSDPEGAFSRLVRTDYSKDLHKAVDSGGNLPGGAPYRIKSDDADKDGGNDEGRDKSEGKEGKDKGKGGSLSHESKRYWSAPMPKPLRPNKG